MERGNTFSDERVQRRRLDGSINVPGAVEQPSTSR